MAMQAPYLGYVSALRMLPYDQMEGSVFSSVHVNAVLAQEIDRMNIPVMTPKLLAACYFVDRIMECEGRLYAAVGVDEISRNQLLSGMARVHGHFTRTRYAWMDDDPMIAGAILLELSELQRLRLEAYRTVMGWKFDVQQTAVDFEDHVHPKELAGLMPALTGLQTFFLEMLGRAHHVDLMERGFAEAFFFPSGRPDSGNISVLPNGEIGTVPFTDDDKTDPTDTYYVTPTQPTVTAIALDDVDGTPTVPLPLVVAKHGQIVAETPPIPLVVRR